MVGAPAKSLHRLMRAVVALGLCELDDTGRYSLTGAGRMFAASQPGGVANWASLMTRTVDSAGMGAAQAPR